MPSPRPRDPSQTDDTSSPVVTEGPLAVLPLALHTQRVDADEALLTRRLLAAAHLTRLRAEIGDGAEAQPLLDWARDELDELLAVHGGEPGPEATQELERVIEQAIERWRARSG